MKYNFIRAGIPSNSDPLESISDDKSSIQKPPTPDHVRIQRRMSKKENRDAQLKRLESVEKRRQYEDAMTQDRMLTLISNLQKMNVKDDVIVNKCIDALASRAAAPPPVPRQEFSFSHDPEGVSGMQKEVKPCAQLPEFDGSEGGLSVKTFVKEVDRLRRNRGWSDGYTAEMVRMKLSGQARVWLRNHGDKSWANKYSTIKPHLMSRFYYQVLLSEKLQVKKHLAFDLRRHENHADFYDEIVSKQDILFDHGQVEVDWSSTHTLEECKTLQFLDLFLLGAAPAVRQKVLEGKCTTLNECLEVARTYEAALRGRDFRDKRRPGASYEVNGIEIDVDPEELASYGYTEQDVAIMALRAGNAPLQCYYCGEGAHFKRDCPRLNADIASGSVKPDAAGKFAGQPPKPINRRTGPPPQQAAAMTGPPRRAPFPRRPMVFRRGRGTGPPRRGWRPHQTMQPFLTAGSEI